jgi:hypothetical protein
MDRMYGLKLTTDLPKVVAIKPLPDAFALPYRNA